MLKHIDPLLTGELLDVMQTMGHGDDLVICDRNHPAATIAAHTTHGSLIIIAGATLPELSRAILRHFPLDTFVDAPVTRMQVVGGPADELVQAHRDMQRKRTRRKEGRSACRRWNASPSTRRRSAPSQSCRPPIPDPMAASS